MDLLPEHWASNQIVFSKQQPRCEYKIHHRAESLRFLSEYSTLLRMEDLKSGNEFLGSALTFKIILKTRKHF